MTSERQERRRFKRGLPSSPLRRSSDQPPKPLENLRRCNHPDGGVQDATRPRTGPSPPDLTRSKHWFSRTSFARYGGPGVQKEARVCPTVNCLFAPISDNSNIRRKTCCAPSNGAKHRRLKSCGAITQDRSSRPRRS